MSSSGYHVGDPGSDPGSDDDDNNDNEQQLRAFADAWVALRCAGKTPGYRAKTHRNAIAENGSAALALRRQHPHLTWADIAKRIAGSGDPDQPDYVAMADAAQRNEAWNAHQIAAIEAREAAENAAIAEHGHLDTAALRDAITQPRSDP